MVGVRVDNFVGTFGEAENDVFVAEYVGDVEMDVAVFQIELVGTGKACGIYDEQSSS